MVYHHIPLINHYMEGFSIWMIKFLIYMEGFSLKKCNLSIFFLYPKMSDM